MSYIVIEDRYISQTSYLHMSFPQATKPHNFKIGKQFNFLEFKLTSVSNIISDNIILYFMYIYF